MSEESRQTGTGDLDWDLEQLEVIIEDPSSWQLVTAGPGAGKSAVACRRVAFLVDEGIEPSNILLVSFARTAVAELRDRIVSYSVADVRARSVRISTVDSHAWSLRFGCDDEPLADAFGDDSYDLSIARTVELFREENPYLLDFMGRLEHLIIDEAQDVVGIRADLVVEMLSCLADGCGVTILADPAQAIYGFTTDANDHASGDSSLLDRLATEPPRRLLSRTLLNNHRIKNPSLAELFLRTRREVELTQDAEAHIDRVQQMIQDSCGKDIGVKSYSDVAEFVGSIQDESTLVLFRRRADVIVTSSYCSAAGVEHRLRMSGLPIVVRPWLGWLLCELDQAIIGRATFDDLWETRAGLVPNAFDRENRDEGWNLLHRLAAGRRPKSIDLIHLRRLVSRARPPVELCDSELGEGGPILGTIHASKGREADTVVLVMPPPYNANRDGQRVDDTAPIFEEGRVYYVGATRARQVLFAGRNKALRAGHLDSNRVFRWLKDRNGQLEIGRNGDVDPIAHLAWGGAMGVQRTLASLVGRTLRVQTNASAEHDYVQRIRLEDKGEDGVTRYPEIGQMSESFNYDFKNLWSLVDSGSTLRPPTSIYNLHLVAVTTVGLTEAQQSAVRPPFSQSGFALAPVVKGFPSIQFLYRQRRGSA